MDEDDEWVGFWIGALAGPRLEVTHVAPLGNLDEGWHSFLIEASVPGFTARFECATLLDVLAGFRDEVSSMRETLRGNAALRFEEQNVHVHGEMIDLYGHVLWKIELQYPADRDAAVLRFEISDDQTMLWNVVAKIDSLLERVGYVQP